MKTRLLKKWSFYFIMLLSMTHFSNSVAAQSTDEIINGSYFVAFGRFANSSELGYWRQNIGNKNIKQMVANHKDFMKSNQYEREQTVKRSYLDAFGWQPSADELRYWSSQNKSYGELMTNHINNWLNAYPDKKELVIKQSYHKAFNRSATTDEVRYWMSQPTYSFSQLVATHITWRQNNEKKSTATPIKANIRENGVISVSFSSQAIHGVVAAGGMNLVAPSGGNVVAGGSLN